MAWLLVCDVLTKWYPAGHANHISLETGTMTSLPTEQNQQAEPGHHHSLIPSIQKEWNVANALLGEAGLSGLTHQPGRGQPPSSPIHHQNSMSTKVPSKNECDHSPKVTTRHKDTQEATGRAAGSPSQIPSFGSMA